MPIPLPSRYLVGREIGRGGMGIVYEADDNRLGRKVAIKVLHTGTESAERKRRFAQEARAASALNHPNIVTVHDIDTVADSDFIVMELIDGVPLSRLSHDAPMPIDRAIDYAMQIAGALAASHAADIVHRDLKPANVMLTPEGVIKVLDFGLSKWTAEPAAAADAATMTSAPQVAAMVERSLPEIERLASAGQYVDAYRLGEDVARAAPGDPRADVYFKDYSDVDGSWQLVGRVPIKDRRIPLGELRWRLVKDGFDTTEGSSPIGPVNSLRPTGQAPPGMVFVRGDGLETGRRRSNFRISGWTSTK
jgi:serine/threonine protein kinase